MFENVGRSVVALGGAAGLTFCLAGGVAVGIVPQAGGTSVAEGRPAAVVQDVTAAPAPEAAAPTTVAPEAAPPPDTTPATTPRSAAAAEEQVTYSEEEPAAVEAEASAPAGPIGVARVNPSSAQVKAAIAQIGGGLPVNEAQARQFGNEVCSAFDAGQPAATVKATALDAARQIPFVKVSAIQVDVAVNTAVQLFCPGHASAL